MTTQQIEAPTLGPPGSACQDCGAALAIDQRYCLHCGARRGDARLPFRDILSRPQPASVARAGGGPAGNGGEPSAPRATGAAFLAGLACLLLALGVGVLIGRSGGSQDPVAAAAPQVITVNGAAAPATAGTGATTTPASSSASGSTAATKSSSKKKASSSAAGDGASTSAIKKLQNASPADYAKQSKKLPKQVGTGGKPTKVDKSKPAGGGSGFQDIG